jgi:hypothetical protein
MKTRNIINIIISLFMIIGFTGAMAFGLTGLTENIGQGEINWESGIISVTGVGAAPPDANRTVAPLLAKRAAMLDAYRNAVEVINGIRVRSGSFMKDFTIVSDEVSGQVEGFIKGGRFDKPVYDSEGRCEIVLNLPVGGHAGLTSVIYDPVKQSLPAAPVTPAMPDDTFTGEDMTGNIPEAVAYTGLIIDARGLGVKPALCPQVFDTDGYLLYNANMVDITAPGFTTVAAYSKTMEHAKSLSRVGNNPLIVKATGVVKGSGEAADVIIGSSDSIIFRQSSSKDTIISSAAVAIVVN